MFSSMRQNRTIISLFIAIGFIFFFALFRSPDAPRAEDDFWQDKVYAPAKYDFVAIGDSRVGLGLAPTIIESILPDYSVLVFDFDAGGLNTEIFEAATKKLDSKSSHKTIFVGISPRALTPDTAINERYNEYIKTDYFENLMMPLAPYFRPVDVPTLATQLLPLPSVKSENKKQAPVIIRYGEGGERIAQVNGNIDKKETIKQYTEIFSTTSFSQQLLDETAKQIEKWREAGICVYGTRLPISEALLDLENKLSGFDENHVRSTLERAGLIWIEIDMTYYETYDGSHLYEESARQLSQVIASTIQEDTCYKHQF